MVEDVESLYLDDDWISLKDFKAGSVWLFQVESGVINISDLNMIFYERNED